MVKKKAAKMTPPADLPKSAFARSEDQIRVRTDRFRQLYANNMQVGFSSWDLAITFGEIMGEQDEKPVIEETTRILMTREIAKVLSKILTAHIEIYEKQFGEIKIATMPSESEVAEAEPTIDATELPVSG